RWQSPGIGSVDLLQRAYVTLGNDLLIEEGVGRLHRLQDFFHWSLPPFRGSLVNSAERPAQQRRPGAASTLGAAYEAAGCWSAGLVIVASRGWAEPVPRSSGIKGVPCPFVGFSGECVPPQPRCGLRLGPQVPGDPDALLQPTAPILLRRRSARQDAGLVHPR